MKINWNLLKAGVLLFALPLVATAAVSASQWVNDTAPIDLNVEVAEIENSIGATRVHTVALNPSGAIEGRVASLEAEGTQGISDLSVYFMSNGKVVHEATTSSDGSFRVEGIIEGNYSFVASGENGFAAYGVKVVGETAGIASVMEAAAVRSSVAVKEILDSNSAQVATEVVANLEDQAIVGANRINLVDGKLVGTVRSLENISVDGTTVYILSGDKQVAKVTTEKDGSFSIDGISPGVYSFVSTGPSGYAAVSFEVVNETETDVEIPVAFSPAAAIIQELGFANSLDVCSTCGTDSFASSDIVYDSAPTCHACQESFAPVEYAGESIGCGGACGATCGSCGNFSGFTQGGAAVGGQPGGLFGGGRLGGGRLLGGGSGGLRRLALLGSIGAIIALAVSDDDNVIVDAGPASPAAP